MGCEFVVGRPTSGHGVLAELDRAWIEEVDLKRTVCPIVESRQMLIQ